MYRSFQDGPIDLTTYLTDAKSVLGQDIELAFVDQVVQTKIILLNLDIYRRRKMMGYIVVRHCTYTYRDIGA